MRRRESKFFLSSATWRMGARIKSIEEAGYTLTHNRQRQLRRDKTKGPKNEPADDRSATKRRPFGVAAWYERVRQRPSFKTAVEDWLTAAEHERYAKEPDPWPKVREILRAA
jgi:hypothetical protein